MSGFIHLIPIDHPKIRHFFMNKINLSLSFLAAMALLGSCKGNKMTQRERPPVTVDILVAGKAEFQTSFEVNGSALSEEMVELYPEVSGRLTYLNIPDGEYVNKGTVLAKINDAELQAELVQQKVQLELAEKTEQRLKKLLEVNGVNQSEYDAALSQVNNISASINILNAQIDKTVIRAPFSGNLGLRMVSPGAYVNTQTLLGTLQQKDKIKIDFTVPETYAKLIEVGRTVSVMTNESDESLPAEVTAIEPQINTATRNVKARARLSSGLLRPGAFVKVILNRSDDRISVPSNAIIPNANSNQLILIKNRKAVFTNVETGLRNAEAVEILSGVNPGDSIVVSGVLFVRPNAVVKIGKVTSLATRINPDQKDSPK
jgi:membrane fusion protein, multidrug efflux system